VEFEKLRVRPNVRRVVRDEDGYVADDLDLFAAAVRAQARPLVEEEELFEPGVLDLDGESLARRVERGCVASDERLLPISPGDFVALPLQRAVERVIVEPRRRRLLELLELAAHARRVRALEVLESFSEQRLLELDGL